MPIVCRSRTADVAQLRPWLRLTLDLAQPVLEQGEPLREERRAVRELGDYGREVQEQDEHEEHREDEERVGRVGHSERLREVVQSRAPEREAEDHAGGGQPEERIALAELPRADQLDHDPEQDDRGERGEELDGHQSWIARCSRGKRLTNSASSTLAT